MQTSMSSIRVPAALSGVLAAIAVALGASGANSQTPAPAPVPPPPMYEYAVKFVCGRAVATPAGQPPVAPGYYFTDTNVHYPGSESVTFRKKFALALINQKPGKVSEFFKATLKSDEAFSVECAEITKGLGLGTGSFATGFLVFQSPRELDIVAVYTAAGTPAGPVAVFHTERVPKRP